MEAYTRVRKERTEGDIQENEVCGALLGKRLHNWCTVAGYL
jgi:hypothetical protein